MITMATASSVIAAYTHRDHIYIVAAVFSQSVTVIDGRSGRAPEKHPATK